MLPKYCSVASLNPNLEIRVSNATSYASASPYKAEVDAMKVSAEVKVKSLIKELATCS
jgi:hypothetical protein